MSAVLFRIAGAALIGFGVLGAHCGSDGGSDDGGGGSGGEEGSLVTLPERLPGGDNAVGSLAIDGALEEDLDEIIGQFSGVADKARVLAFSQSGSTVFRILNGLSNIGLSTGVNVVDGPAGVISPAKTFIDRATVFPGAILRAASWDLDLEARVGQAMALETRENDSSVLLAPGVNLYRIPNNGRSFEYYGEDPYLVSQMGVAFIKAVQAENVVSTVKHYCCNNVEFDRQNTDSTLDERTLHEIYLPAYRAAAQEAGAWSMMAAYNGVNGFEATENEDLISILKERWGYRGFLMSDWDAVASQAALPAGLDLEMPNPKHLAPSVVEELVNSGEIDEADVDDAAKRIFRAMVGSGALEYQPDSQTLEVLGPSGVSWSDHNDLVLEVAQAGIVLLKNEGNALPVTATNSVLVLGNQRLLEETPRLGSGSANVRPGSTQYTTDNTIEDRMEEVAGASNTVEFETFAGNFGAISSLSSESGDLSQEVITKIENSDVVIVATGYATIGEGFFATGNEGENKERPFQLPDGQDRLIEQTVAAIAADNDGSRASLVVTITAGGAVDMSRWADNVDAIVHSWYLGQAVRALADVLFGAVNPSGKLPISIERVRSDSSTYNSYDQNTDPSSRSGFNIKALVESAWSRSEAGDQVSPGTNALYDLRYGEGLFVGYRHFDRYQDADTRAKYFQASGATLAGDQYYPDSTPLQGDGSYKTDIEPLFAFGHGLSYTTFSYSNLQLTTPDQPDREHAMTVALDVTNDGSMDGAEVVQIYVREVDWDTSFPRPYKELKGFDKVEIAANATERVSIDLGADAFAYYDPSAGDDGAWVIRPGDFEILIGSSSRVADIKLRQTVTASSTNEGANIEFDLGN